MRVVALIACGTRALLGAAIGPLADGEQKLAATLTGCLRPGMLLLADRGFWSIALWQACAATARPPAVARQVRHPPPRPPAAARRVVAVGGQRHPRGAPAEHAQRQPPQPRLPPPPGGRPAPRRRHRPRHRVPHHPHLRGRHHPHRAVPRRHHPAGLAPLPRADLAAAYARRWGIESAYREAKSYLAGGRVLRSRTPGLARQEAWALLITYQAIRALICHAAAGTDPGRLSFTTALHAARRTLASPAATLATAGSEILANPLPGRPPRTCARALADPTRPYPARNGKPQPLPQAARYTLTITPPGTPTWQRHDQHQQATNRAATPP